MYDWFLLLLAVAATFTAALVAAVESAIAVLRGLCLLLRRVLRRR